MTGVNDHGQVSALLQIRDGGQWQCETRMSLEGANPTFTENHLGVSLVENVLGRQQEFVDRGALLGWETREFVDGAVDLASACRMRAGEPKNWSG